jgi:hypothetical protein
VCVHITALIVGEVSLDACDANLNPWHRYRLLFAAGSLALLALPFPFAGALLVPLRPSLAPFAADLDRDAPADTFDSGVQMLSANACAASPIEWAWADNRLRSRSES